MNTHISATAAGSATESGISAISWSSIMGGGIAAAALSIILVFLGTGVGLAMASPFSHPGAAAFTALSAIWFVILQWIPSGIGGYLTGRLRKRWPGAHVHEVFFRDTAHGFMAWAVATLIAAVVAVSAGSAVLHGAAGAAEGMSAAAPSMRGHGAERGSGSEYASMDYDVDLLFRTERPSEAVSPAEVRMETGRILMKGFVDGSVSTADRDYLAQLVASRTGQSKATARERVDEVMSRVAQASADAKEAANKARKAASASALFTALSLFIGAFIACVAAALGGRTRDEQ